MKKELINFIANINFAYLSIVVILFIISFIFLSHKKIKPLLKQIYVIVYVIIIWIGFLIFNDRLNAVFKLQYSNIKTYLLLLIIVNIITVININFIKSKKYKIINYLMFSINLLIFMINVILILTNRLNLTNITIDHVLKVININYIIFIIYINIICYIYLIEIIINKIKDIILEKKLTKQYKQEIDNSISEPIEENIIIEEPETNDIIKDNIPINSNTFIIDGIDCSAIFDSNNKEETYKNYYILLNDVNAKLTNGYTIQEYTKIKDIINRLNIKDINNINLDINQLSMITYDEYNLLKNYLNSKNIKI
ncbi:MAG: hypothetical protein VZS44_01460 [Bacilli bacterium]|nr:hypothetical protein [Bacilli bacterium]